MVVTAGQIKLRDGDAGDDRRRRRGPASRRGRARRTRNNGCRLAKTDAATAAPKS